LRLARLLSEDGIGVANQCEHTRQTYIEPIMDLWTREKKKWNIFSTDPKGGAPRSIVKSYGLAV